MAEVHETDLIASRVDPSEAERGERLGRPALAKQDRLETFDDGQRIRATLAQRLPADAEHGTQRGGVRAVAADVAADHGHAVLAAVEDVDEVAAQLEVVLAGTVVGEDAHALGLHRDRRHEAALEAAMKLLRLAQAGHGLGVRSRQAVVDNSAEEEQCREHEEEVADEVRPGRDRVVEAEPELRDDAGHQRRTKQAKGVRRELIPLAPQQRDREHEEEGDDVLRHLLEGRQARRRERDREDLPQVDARQQERVAGGDSRRGRDAGSGAGRRRRARR